MSAELEKSTLVNEIVSKEHLTIVKDSQIAFVKIFGLSSLKAIRYSPGKFISLLVYLNRSLSRGRYVKLASTIALQEFGQDLNRLPVDSQGRLLRLVELMEAIDWWCESVSDNPKFNGNPPWLIIEEGLVQKLASLGIESANAPQLKSVELIFDVQIQNEESLRRVNSRFYKSGRLTARHSGLNPDEINKDQAEFRKSINQLFVLNPDLAKKSHKINAVDVISTNVEKVLESYAPMRLAIIIPSLNIGGAEIAATTFSKHACKKG